MEEAQIELKQQQQEATALQQKQKLEQIEAAQNRLKSAFSAWDGSHLDLTRTIKNAMNDPSSFEHVDTRFGENEDGKTLTVKTTFRGKNAFGGIILQSATAKTDISTGKVIEIVEQE